jgi:5-methylcytosine-specific restriction endonuclease McrA
MGRARRLVRGPQRRALVLRDRGCVLCGRPPSWCTGHHRRHWIDGGPTDLPNLALLCSRCHYKIHEGGWKLVTDREGNFTAIPP